MPASNAFSYLSSLPGARPMAPKPSAVQSVQSFQNQQLGGLMSGTAAQAAPAAAQTPQTQRPIDLKPDAIAQGTNLSVRQNSQGLLQSAQLQRKRQDAEKAAAQAKAMQDAALRASQGGYGGGGSGTQQGGSYGGGGGASQQGGYVVGAHGRRIEGILARYPGLHITETLGNREYDVANGVDRVPGSYHYDANDPAVDIAGSQEQLWALYNQLQQEGGWRQILWQVPGHYDHIHVAAEGGHIGVPESPFSAATAPVGADTGEDTVPLMAKPGEFMMTKEATDAIGPDVLDGINKTMSGGAPAVTPAPSGTTTQGADVTGLVVKAYQGTPVAHHIKPGTPVAGVRTTVPNLRPGDLVVWRDGSHVAVWAGNGEVLDGKSRRRMWAPEDAVYGIALRLPGE